MTRSEVMPERLLHVRLPGRPVFAPDGRRVAFSVASAFALPGEPPSRHVWVASDDATPLAVAATVSAAACWSPDGSKVAFAARHETPGQTSLHVRDMGAGKTATLAHVDGAVERMVWASHDDALIVLVAAAGPSPPVDDPWVARPAQVRRRLHRVDAASGHSDPIGPAGLAVWDFDARDGLVAGVLSRDPSESGWYGSFLGLIDLERGSHQSVYVPQWQIAHPRLSPDGRRVAFVEGLCSDRGSEVGTVKVVDVDSGEVREIAADVDVAGLAWRDAARLWYSGRRGVTSSCGWLLLDGGTEEIWSGEAVVRDFTASPDGRRLVAVVESPTEPPEICELPVAEQVPQWRRVTSLNLALTGLDLPRVERLDWCAPDGLRVEGLVVRPPGVHAPAPTVVMVHGGPTASWSYAFPSGARHAALLAEAGYAVLLPNSRGSSGRGQAFAQAVIGDLGGAELHDILAGVDACVDAGIADSDRVGIMGASHGGFMAAWAVTQTARFRATVALACVSDYVSLHFTSNIGGLDDILFGGRDRIASYLERSPVAHASRCTTPTLILHGEQDDCCPVGQAHELYGALSEAGVETELVVYPREGHGWIEHAHQLDVWRRILGWFDRHLGGDP